MTTKNSFWADKWPEIDKWHHDEGLSYGKIQIRCTEIWGRKPSKGTLSPHFSKESFDNNKKRTQNYRATLRGSISKKMNPFQNKKSERGEADKSSLTCLRDIIAKRIG